MREKLIELVKDILDWAHWGQISSHTAEDVADHLIDNDVTVQRWIPVTERLPKLYEPVLVKYLSYYDGTASPTNVDVAVLLDENAWYWWEGDVGGCDEDAKCTITHWMPLPKEEN